MFGINGPEFILLLIIGLLVIGPSRLPEYTQKLANIVKEVRRMASGAREQIKEEVGIDIDDVDWKKYDPRQYDPAGSSARPCWRMTPSRSMPVLPRP